MESNSLSPNIRLIPNISTYLTDDIYHKLSSQGIKNAIDLLIQDPEELAYKIKVSYKVIRNICKIVRQHLRPPACTGLSIHNEALNKSLILSTGFRSLDSLIGGGLLTSEILEIWGPSCTGKSLVSFAVALFTARSHGVLYFDATNFLQPLFQSSRFKDAALKIEVGGASSKRMRIVHSKSVWEVLKTLDDMEKGVGADKKWLKSLRLIVVDSLPVLLSPLLGVSYDHFGVVSLIKQKLCSTTQSLNLSTIVVNTSVRTTEEEAPGSGKVLLKPDLGRIWQHVPHVRLQFEKKTSSVATTKGNAVLSDELSGVSIRINKSTRLKTRRDCFVPFDSIEKAIFQ